MHRAVLDSTDSRLLKEALTQAIVTSGMHADRYISIGSQSTH